MYIKTKHDRSGLMMNDSNDTDVEGTNDAYFIL